jgi:glycerol uptake facilitator-like aquaporin
MAEGFGKTIRDSLLILIFEFLGTAMLALLYNNAAVYSEITGFLLGIWICIIFGAKISGSHYNPAVTLAFMFRKDVGRFSRKLGFAYIIF